MNEPGYMQIDDAELAGVFNMGAPITDNIFILERRK